MKPALVLMLALAAQPAFAEVRYDYTGTALGPNVIALFSPGDSVTGFFIVGSAPVSGNFAATDLLDYQFQLGGLTLSKQQGSDVGAHLEFGSNGEIVSWSFVIGNYLPSQPDPSLVEIWTNSPDLPPGGTRIVARYEGRDQLAAVTGSGSWTLTSAIPEPSAALLLATGGAMLMAFRTRQPVKSR